MTRTIEPNFTDTEDLRFLKTTFAVHDRKSRVVFPVSPSDFAGIKDLTEEAIKRVVSQKADALVQLRDE